MLKTLRSKLLFFFLSTTFLSLLLVGYISYESKKAAITNNIEQSFYMFSDFLALNVEELIREAIHDVSYLAENSIIKNPNSTYEDIQLEIEKFIEFHPIYTDAIFVDANGIVKVDIIGGVLEGNDFNDRRWFQQAMNGETYFSDVYLSPVINKPMLVTGAPVIDDENNIIGAVSPAFNLEEFWSRIYKFSDLQNKIGKDGYAFIFNEKGDIISHPNENKILNVNYFHISNFDINHIHDKIKNKSLCDHEARLEVGAYSKIQPIPGFHNNWFIGIAVPKDDLFAPLNKLLINYTIIYGIVLIVTILAIVKFSHYLVRPIENLVAATSHLSSGKEFVPIETDSYKEINLLSDQFNEMVNKINEREKTHKKSTLILETTDNGIFAINKSTMRITTFNSTCERLFSINKNEILYKSVDEACKKSELFLYLLKGQLFLKN